MSEIPKGNLLKDSPQLRSLGAELREYRVKAGWTLRDLAHWLGGHHSKYARFEAGEAVPAPHMVASIMAALGAKEHEWKPLADIASNAPDGNWLKPGVLREDELTSLIEFERSATDIIAVTPLVVPGLLQSFHYARAIMSLMWPEEVEARTMMRIRRQDVLAVPNPPEFAAIITESALREAVGGTVVMAEQLRHIVAMSKRSNVTIQVVPADARMNPAHVGQFTHFDFPNASSIVCLEHLSSTAFLSRDEDVQVYENAIEMLRRKAMPPDETRDMIVQLAEEMEDNGT